CVDADGPGTHRWKRLHLPAAGAGGDRRPGDLHAADAAAGAGAVPAGGTPSGTTAGTPGCGGGAWLCGSVRWRQAFSALRYPRRPQEEGAAAAADATGAAAAGY